MSVLIAFGTIEGQTGKIARFIEDIARTRGDQVRLHDTLDRADTVSVTDYDAVILAASVHERRHPADFEVFVTASKEALRRCRTLFLSVSLSAAFPEGLEEAQDYADEMKMRTGLKPDAELLVAGAVRTHKYDFYATQVMRHVVLRGRVFDPTIKEHEFTDWDRLRDVVTGFLP